MSGSASLSVGLAHSVTDHSGRHGVGVRIGQATVSEGGTSISSGSTLVALSMEDYLKGAGGSLDVFSTGLHKSLDGALFGEGIGDLGGPLVAAGTFRLGGEIFVVLAGCDVNDVSVTDSGGACSHDIVNKFGPLLNITSSRV